MRNLLLVVLGLLFSLWIALGRWAFGAGGELGWWYALLIALPFALLQILTVLRLRVAEDRGRPAGRAVFVALALSWLCALGFGLTVPDVVDGELVSAMGVLGGQAWNDMAIALCNPLGIIAFATAAAALIFAQFAARERRLTEDELLDAADTEEVSMVRHPLER